MLRRLEDLISPFGVVSQVAPRRGPRGLGLDMFAASLGVPNSRHRHGPTAAAARMIGTAKGLGDRERTRLIAVAEAAERYSGGAHAGDISPWMPASELDGDVVDFSTIPQCSPKELRTDGCPLTALDPEAPMRWTRGTDLLTGTPVWIPAVMACYHLDDVRSAERFWFRISTGYAVHTDPLEALVRGVCEVVERDMIALTWLQRLPLRPISEHCVSELLDHLLVWSRKHFLTTYLLDATSDIGVPAVYCLQIAEHDDEVRQSVACATGRDITEAAEHALLDAIGSRCLGYAGGPVKEFRDFSGVTDGASYMGRPEMSAEFDFLVKGAEAAPAPPRPGIPRESAEALKTLVGSLSNAGMQVIAVDRTPTELSDVGLTATTVVIPKLMPMSLLPLAQYRAHPRLYEGPELMGHRSFAEEELNPWPQPFA